MPFHGSIPRGSNPRDEFFKVGFLHSVDNTPVSMLMVSNASNVIDLEPSFIFSFYWLAFYTTDAKALFIFGRNAYTNKITVWDHVLFM